MFGSPNPFGQSSSPFGAQSVFGQTSSGGMNPFAPKPFGSSPNPFGSQTGSSMFGGTSTGVFGQASSPLVSTPAFGASLSAFGSSVPAFGASSAPAFGNSTSTFGGSAFGQKPAFGGFGSTPTQSSSFGGTFQQTQSAFGSNPFGSTTPFGGTSQPAFGVTSTPAFGSTSTPSFGNASTSAFGSTPTPAFGATTTPAFGSTAAPAFGSTPTPLFGSTGTAFGVSSAPAFGSTATSAFGASSTPLFGSSSTGAFGVSSTPTFGSSSVPAFGSASNPFSTTTPTFGQTASTFGSTSFGTTPSPFGSQSIPFGGQTTASAFGSQGFGQSPFGGQPGGSRVAAYTPTPDTDGASGTQPAGKLESISAMPVYKDKSHEELRWEDYQRGDKGGPNPSGQPATGISFPTSTQSNPFGSTGTFGQPASNPFSSSTTSNLFAPKTSTFSSPGFGSASTSLFTSTSSPFSSSSPNLFGASSTTPVFGATSSSGFGLNTSPSLFGGATTSASNSSFSPSLTFGNTQSSGLFQSTTPSIGQTSSLFGQQSAGFQQTTGFGSNLFSTPSTGFGGGLFSSTTPSLLTGSNPAGFGQTTPSLSTFPTAANPQTSNVFGGFGGFGQPQSAPSGSVGNTSNIFSQGSFGQSYLPTQLNMVTQPAPITNPFGTLPAVPQMSIGRVGSAPSVQYGISSMPVAEKPNPVRISSLLTPRHISQRRIRLPARKYHPKNDGQKVPFFTDDEETPTTPKADALFIPRENPRALIIRPIEQWPSRNTEKHSMQKDNHLANSNGKVSDESSAPAFNESCMDHYEGPIENGHKDSGDPSPSGHMQKPNGTHADHAQKGVDSSFITITGHRAGEAAIVYEHGADIEALMPKLRHTDYYTEPRIQELAAKERADPGFCRHVKNFVVGRHGYGSIKFFGETDVRRLDLESIVQFNNREVIVYRDESKKPPVGQGLNKPAEVTLLNIKCINKKTGQQYNEVAKVEKYKEMLMKKAEEQGAEFVSYDPIKGEWKFKVTHFSLYGIGDGNPDESGCYEFGGGGAVFSQF